MRAAGNERTVEFPAAFYFTKQVLFIDKEFIQFYNDFTTDWPVQSEKFNLKESEMEEAMISKFSVKKPYTVIVAVVLVIILGVVSFTKMSTDLLPSMDLPYAIVMTTYQGQVLKP